MNERKVNQSQKKIETFQNKIIKKKEKTFQYISLLFKVYKLDQREE